MECCLEIIGILKQAGNAKKQTDIAGEKEILQISATSAMGKSKYGDITKEKLDAELDKYPEIESTEQTDKGIVVTFKSNRAYLVNYAGDISSYQDITIGNLVVKDGNTTLVENCKSVQLGKALTISFDASISGGSITSITPNIAYTTTGERSKTFTIIGKTSDGQEITKEYTVNLNGYYNIPDLKVGDFVNYALKTPTAEQLTQLNNDISTYSGATDNTTKISAGSTLLCRVLEMDSNGNPTKLISANGVNALKLSGADGYNNAVYLINEMCKTLYSGNQGTTTSLTIEDLENNYFAPTARDTAKSKASYGIKTYYASNAKYPNIAQEEAGMGIGTELVDGKNTIREGGLGLSQQTTTYKGSGDASTLDATKKGITVPKTYYQLYARDSNYMNAILNNIIHKSPTASSNITDVSTYWLASRCVDTYPSYCNFNVRLICPDYVYYYFLFAPDGYTGSNNSAVRPIINLNSGIQAEYVEAYNDTYNIWNLN